MKPFSQSTENNKEPILEVLRDHLTCAMSVLEIGSGTGQHAVFFAQHLPHIQWQTSDLPEAHAGIHAWMHEAALKNVLAPLALNVDDKPWGVGMFDAAFTANTAHIMSWASVVNLLEGVAQALRSCGKFFLYGPFNYNGEYTSEGNANFDGILRARDPASGIRDFEALRSTAADNGLSLHEDVAMPANNRLLIWTKTEICR